MASALKLRAALKSREASRAASLREAETPLEALRMQVQGFSSLYKLASAADPEAAKATAKQAAEQVAVAADELARIISQQIERLEQDRERRTTR